MSLITEAMEQLQMKAFLQETDVKSFSDVSGRVNQIQWLMKDPIKNKKLIQELWNKSMVVVEEFEANFNNSKVYASANK